MKDEVIVKSRLGKVVRLNDRSNVDLRLSKIPVELHPAVNHIALELAHTSGWECSPDLDFVNSDDTRTIRFARLALTAMVELQEFCLDVWGTSLNDLVKDNEL